MWFATLTVNLIFSPNLSSTMAAIPATELAVQLHKWARGQDSPFESAAEPLVELPGLPTHPFPILDVRHSCWIPNEQQVGMIEAHIDELESQLDSLQSFTELVIHRYGDLTTSIEALRSWTVLDQLELEAAGQRPRLRSTTPLVELPDFPTPPSSVTDILRSQSAPNSLQLHKVNAYIGQLESQLASLKSVTKLIIGRVKSLSGSMHVHKSSIQRHEDSRKADRAAPPGSCPVDRMPAEILAYIFSLLVENQFHYAAFSNPYNRVPKQAPWLFTRVCRRWARVALGCTLLWNRVSFPLHSRMPKHGAAPLMNLLHDRSGSAPLMVNIYDHHKCYTDDCFDVVLQHADRWKTLYIELSKPPILGKLEALRGRLRNLTRLKFQYLWSADTLSAMEDVPGFWDIFSEDVPELRTVRAEFRGDDGFSVRSPFTFPWCQLTRLATTFASGAEALSIFEQLSSIVELQVTYATPGTFSSKQEIISLPHLRILELILVDDPSNEPMYWASIPCLLDYMDTPILEHFHAQGGADEKAILRLVERSGCTRSLRVIALFLNGTLHAETILSIVRALPCLARLDMFAGMEFEELIDQLISCRKAMVAPAPVCELTVQVECGGAAVDPEVPPPTCDGIKVEWGEFRGPPTISPINTWF